MTAPAFVLLADNESDPRVQAIATKLTGRLHEARPDLHVDLAYTEPRSQGSRTAPSRLFSKFFKSGIDEVVLAPLKFGQVGRFGVEIAEIRHQNPDLGFATIRPMTINPTLLNAVDRQLRAALKRVRARELDSLVLAYDGPAPALDSPDNAGIVRLARAWGQHHKLPVVTAYIGAGSPSPAEAVLNLRRAGKRNVAVGQVAITPTPTSEHELSQAQLAGAIAISDPIGDSDEVVEQLQLAYTVAAFDLLDLGPSLSMAGQQSA